MRRHNAGALPIPHMSTWQRFMQAPDPGSAFRVLQQDARQRPSQPPRNHLNMGGRFTRPAGRPMANLPASARVPSQYPQGVPTGVGGGNAGASRDRPAFSGPPDKAPIRDSFSSDQRQLQRANATAGAGLHGVTNAPGQGPVQAPANFWKAKENAEVERAAREAGEAAQRARHEQKMGYLSRGMGLPATSDPTQDAYWARADNVMFAKANPELAKRNGWDPNRDYSAAMNASSVQGIGPVADVDQYARTLGAVQGTTGIGPFTDGDTYGQIITPVAPPAAGAAAPDTATQASFTPEALAQAQAGDILNSFTANIKASGAVQPEVDFQALREMDTGEINRNAYGTRFNTRQFF